MTAAFTPVPGFDLTGLNTMGLASRARYGARVTEPDQLAELARFAASAGLPLHVVGGGSNLILRDRLDAVVAVIATKGRDTARLPDGRRTVTAKAGEDWSDFVAWAVENGHWGLENLAGIPGTVGAAPVQNIGAYGLELSQLFHSLTAYDLVDGVRRVFAAEECDFSYRHSVFKKSAGRFVILDVTLALPQDWRPLLGYAGIDSLPTDADAPTIMRQVLSVRAAKLPDWRKLGNAGSFFHNPIVAPTVAEAIPGAPRYPQADGNVKLSAAWLIEACGLKGAREGQAGVYEKHALIVVNHGGATYDEIERLAARIRASVRDRFGVELIQEPIRL